jgi:hypothetical protein
MRNLMSEPVFFYEVVVEGFENKSVIVPARNLNHARHRADAKFNCAWLAIIANNYVLDNPAFDYETVYVN